jgi:NAD(P)-dependent dehydrogenase (short-subunit alcohol dehydrogenase family)
VFCRFRLKTWHSLTCVKGLVPAFARAGPKAIVLVARNATALAEVAEEVRKINSSIQVLQVPTDITNPASVDGLFAKVKSIFGTAEVLVNNSGVLSGLSPIRDVPETTWWRDFVSHSRFSFLE